LPHQFQLRLPAGITIAEGFGICSDIPGDDLEKIPLGLAKLILDATLVPDALSLHRIIASESMRFSGTRECRFSGRTRAEAVYRIGALLESETAAGRIGVQETTFAAAQFLFMIIAILQPPRLV